MADFSIQQNDVLPALTAALAYDDGTPANLAGATVQLVLRNPEASTVVLNATATITGANTVAYNWATGDTATPGDFVAEFVVTFATGITQSFPTAGYFTVTITPSLTGSTKPRPAYVTTADLIQQTRVYLDGKTSATRNRLGAALSSTDETITLKYDAIVAAGETISVGLESMYVWEANGKTLTVERGIENTIPSAHATGDTVLVSPEWTDARILTALNLELAALPSQGVYPVKSLDRTLLAATTGYDLAADVIDVLDVRWQDQIDPTQWTPVETFEVSRSMPTDQFPSGVALLLPDRPYIDPFSVGASSSLKLRIRYRSTFGTLASLFDDVLNVTNLPASALDILPIGAALYLIGGRAIPRVNVGSEPDSRATAEVRVSDVLNAPARLQQMHDKRVTDEAAKLSSEWVFRKPARTLMGSRPLYQRWGFWGRGW